jgi:hypothetical protein
MGWRVFDDCDLGLIVTHSGGYPGYGSNVLLLPEKGIGIFAFANRTYAGPGLPVMQAALLLQGAGAATSRPVPVSERLGRGYDIARTIWRDGDVAAARGGLAMNFLLDRDAAHWRSELARLRAEAGDCPADEAVMPATAMEGRFVWRCARARIEGHLLLAPTPEVRLQALELRLLP